MADTVILLVIKKIGIIVGNEAGAQFAKLRTLQASMGRIMRVLRVMHDFIYQMDIRDRNNQVYEGWLEELHKVVYAIEDMVDEYLYLVGQKSDDVGCCFYMKKGVKKPKSLLTLRTMASKMDEIEKDLTQLSQLKEQWVPMRTSNSNNYIVKRSQDLACDSRSLGEEDLVGIEDNKQTLEKWLRDDELTNPIIVLHGMGGLGKTALAATIYKREREKYDCHAWVSVSQTYTREDIIKRLINELFRDKKGVPSNIASMDLTALRDELKNILDQKKYIIILDDVWNPEAYTALFGALPSNFKGSIVIITTRIYSVAQLASQDRILTLKPLSEDESWELFCKKAFADHECPEEFEILSNQIVGKCEGLPLAIISIGSLLCMREKRTIEWRRIYDQLSWELINNSSLDHLRNVLHLSFIYLSSHLKSCFLYCSLFPEDYLFQRKKLIRLWIAEGFVEERGESTLEEVAESYLNELVHRNMLQLVGKNSFGRIKLLRMHDIMRELAVDLCRRECFGVPYDEDKRGGKSSEKDVRRLVVHKQRNDSKQSMFCADNLRSVVILDNSMPSSSVLPLIAEKCRYISVLELRGLPIEMVPDAIGKLFNLCHLGLRDSKVKLLPKSIEKLSNLRTLDLCNSDIQELPRGIVKLKKLRHLFAGKVINPRWRNSRCRSGVRTPKDLWNLTDLQTLQALEADDESVRHLGELRQMRSIRICNVKESYCERLCKSLVEMRFLSCLHLCASDENEVLQLDNLNPLPVNLEKLRLSGRLAEGMPGEPLVFQPAAGQNLYSLQLFWSQLIEDPLPWISRWSNLTVLGLSRAYNGEQLVFLTGWFPKLKNLWLVDLPNLKRLEIQRGALASLEKLALVNLTSMTEAPPGIELLMPLKYLAFREISRDFLASLRASSIGRMRWRYDLRDELTC